MKKPCYKLGTLGTYIEVAESQLCRPQHKYGPVLIRLPYLCKMSMLPSWGYAHIELALVQAVNRFSSGCTTIAIPMQNRILLIRLHHHGDAHVKVNLTAHEPRILDA